MKITVGIPTVGRASVLCETLRELSLQTRLPDRIVLCGGKPADLEGVELACPSAEILFAEPGLARQRNTIMDCAADSDIVVFFDDDFFADRNYLAAIESFMTADPGTVIVTGAVLADGIKGPGLTPADARAILLRDRQANAAPASRAVKRVFCGYGCNMAVRVAPMQQNALRFDERLPLYGWQEDVDLSRRLAEFGNVVLIEAARGVHLGVKSGRNSGLRLGYSQVANPLYLTSKKHGYPLPRAITHITSNFAMNVVRAAWPEPHIDRRGRLRGNILALYDLLTSRMSPERILEL